MNYKEADKYLLATEALLIGWCGFCRVDGCDDIAVRGGRVVDDTWVGQEQVIELDPTRGWVRDHLMRRFALPEWMRDGEKLMPWQSAGLILCATLGINVSALLGPWWCRGSAGMPAKFARYDRTVIVGNGPSAHYYTGPKKWPYTDTVFRTPEDADAYTLANRCAILLDVDTMVLPFPEPLLWRRT